MSLYTLKTLAISMNCIDTFFPEKSIQGTLTPIRKTPGAAVPQEHMLKALTALAADPNNIVWVISGRDQKVLEEWLGNVKNLGFSAEHGSFMKSPGSSKWVNLTESLDMGWKNDVIEIFTYYTERTQGKPPLILKRIDEALCNCRHCTHIDMPNFSPY